MVLGMVTIVNVTMVGAVMQLAGQVPDSSLLVILSRYLRKKEEGPGTLLHPVEASSRLQRLRRRSGLLALATCVPGLVFTIWASAIGWGTIAGFALAFWVLAGNLGFLTLPLATLARRAFRMQVGEEPEKPAAEGKAPSLRTGGVEAAVDRAEGGSTLSPSGNGPDAGE